MNAKNIKSEIKEVFLAVAKGDLSFESGKVALESIEIKSAFAFEMGVHELIGDAEIMDLYIQSIAGQPNLERLFDFVYDGQEDEFFFEG